MKKTIYTLAILLTGLVAAGTASADVKIKSKQTMGGQTYESTTYIKGKRQRSEMMNGMMVSLTQCDLRRSVQLNPNTKTYMVNAFPETTQTVTKPAAATVDKDGVVRIGGTVTTTVTIQDTGERKQMFGFTARHLIITMETVSSPDACSKTNTKMQTDGWYIDAEFVLDCDYGYSAGSFGGGKSGGCKDRYEFKNVGGGKRGYPVFEKMTMFDQNGRQVSSITTEVLELSKAVLEPALFEVPGDYREAKDPAEMYAAVVSDRTSSGVTPSTTLPKTPASNTVSTLPTTTSAVGPKKEGVVRVGIAVKTGTASGGISASNLAAATQNTLMQYLKTANVEVVTLDPLIDSAIAAEAAQKECDFIVYATVSHKKGGGGFGGMLGAAVGSAIIGSAVGHTGSTAAVIAGQVASEAIITAATVSSDIKSKDEVSLELRVNEIDGTSALTKAYKAKAKSNGEDLITQVVTQAAQAVSAVVAN